MTGAERAGLIALMARLREARVLCVGDVMLDEFVYGEVERISPEAPIPVVRVEREAHMLGGAGNVVRNLAGLGAKTRFVSVVGDDAAGRTVAGLLDAEPGVEAGLITDAARRTTIKTRFIAGTQQMIRADRETAEPADAAVRRAVADAAAGAVADHPVLVLSDYGKGVLDDATLQAIIAAARAADCFVIVDPKGADFARYRGANLITPNLKELAAATGLAVDGDEAVVAAARALVDGLGLDAVLATRSAEGMTLVGRDGAEPAHFPAAAREVFDVSGAGDTVVAALAACIAVGADLADAARIANLAAGIVVGKVGTAVVYADDAVAALHHEDLSRAEAKLLSLDQLRDRVAGWRRRGLKVGFTNGCFDLLHPGHVSLLDQARAACDRLVVGLNSDASVARLKGPERPVQNEAARAAVLASLSPVDAVVLFGEDTPRSLIEAIKPDVLVKGADYTVDQVVGADIVEAHGGRVVLARLEEGHSTTATIARLAGKG